MKKFLSIILAISIFLAVVPLGTFTVSAESEKIFIYSITNGEATISGLWNKEKVAGVIEIPNTIGGCAVTSISKYAFAYCTGLESITIPDGVTSIGTDAFRGCIKLTSVTIPDSVTSINNHAFDNTAWFNDKPDGLVYAGKLAYRYKGACPTNIEIKYGTHGINEFAFYNCTGLASISIPNSVTSIGAGAFYGCTGLTSIIIPQSVTDVHAGAFEECTGLKSIIIPNSVTLIGDRAFCGCSGLASITIPDSVTTIGYDAFSSTAWIKNKPDGLVYAGKVAYLYKGPCPSNVKIKEGTFSITGCAFSYCTGLVSIKIPDSVISIGNGAFSGCSGLKSINIPDGVTSIGNGAFYGCAGLISINIPNGLTKIDDGTFKKCTGITNVIIPDSVTEIGWEAFRDCTGIVSINISEGVTSIGQYAFDNCTGLKTAGPIGGGYDYEFGWEDIVPAHAFSGCSGLESITIPDSVTSIGNGAFSGCSGLASITIPNNVISMGEWVFSGCIGLKTAGPIGRGYDCEFGWTDIIPDYAFCGCAITSVFIPDGVTTIGYGAFKDCTNLTNIIMPNSVTSIGGSAFYGCTGLTSITIPNSVTSIGASVFYGCTGLTSITIPNSVTSIEDFAFYGCTGLTSITIPNSVTSIGSYAFNGCTGLKTVYYCGTEEEWNKISIYSSNDDLISADRKYHLYNNEWFIRTSPTCAVEGLEYSSCTVCGEERTRTIKALGHSFANYISDGNATCTADGTKTAKCDRCDVTNTIADPESKIPHEYINVVDPQYLESSADCLHSAVYYKSCSRCGEKSNETFESDIYMICGADCGFMIENNTLYIHGSGDIDNYKTQGSVPWYEYADSITEIIIDEGITKIGNYAFYCLNNLKSIKTKNNNLAFGKYAINSTNTDITVFAENGGTLETYCAENNINYIDPTITPELQTATANSITVKAVDGYEYSTNGITWKKINTFSGLSPAREYSIYARYAATADMFDTIGAPLNVTTLKSTVATPAAPDYQSHTDSSIALVANDLYEFSIDGDNWQKSSEFTGLSKNTVYRFYQRIAETETEFASPSSAPLVIAIPDKPEILEAGYENILLKKIDGFEYCLDDFIWQDSNEFDMLIDNTEYYVYQKLKAVDGEKVYQITSDYTAVTTDNSIKPITHTSGDINGDASVNNKDLTRLFQYLSGWNVDVNESALDINGDGKVNNKDLTRLFQYLSGWDVEIF